MLYNKLFRIALSSTLFVTVNASVLHAERFRVADNLLIEGHYTQEGQQISRAQLEKYLLNQPYEVANLADKSKGYRMSAYAIGGPLWLVTTGFSIWQIMQFVNIVKRSLNDTSAAAPPTLFYQEIWKFTMPMMIGGETTLFFQNRLRNRSNYMLHKAVKAFDSIVGSKHQVNVLLDHQIKEMKPGWFMQDRLLMPTSLLYSVLNEKSESRGAANSSIVCRAISHSSGFIGLYCATTCATAFLEAGLQEKEINKGVVYSHLGIGIGSLLLATVTSVMSAGIRDKAIQKYNDALPKAPKPLQLFDPIPTEPVDYPPRQR
ncbi:MAG: hypothetical protein JXA71_17595 [Chitinispirillaceae bacterium]|nr:hypothetical protein [Chitinispirillaceae bacterium]